MTGTAITRADLVASKMEFTCHVDGSDYYANYFRNTTWPRLTCVVTRPRRRKSKVQPSKLFFVDGIAVTTCTELLERLNKPQLEVVGGTQADARPAP